jgi:hypothetical protein
MTTWAEFARAEPEFAERVRQLFDVRKHKTIATLRRDGSPRISGIEVSFDAGSVWVGMMPGSVKALDVARDPRVALHSPTVDPPDDDPGGWPGEAKMSGRVVTTEIEGAMRYVLDIDEVVLTRIGTPADHLVVESWHPSRGLERRIRR